MTNSHNKIMTDNQDASKSEHSRNTNDRFFNSTPPYEGRKHGKNHRSPSNKHLLQHKTPSSSVNKVRHEPQFVSNRTPATNISIFANNACGSPPNLYFANSKCYDAPSANALPKPPQHWTAIEHSPCLKTYHTHTLKTLLKIQA